MTVSIIIPIYNEEETILEILRRIESVQLGLKREIIIVDDGSTDGTVDVLRQLDKGRYVVILKTRNEGKGAAIKTGLTRAKGDFVIFQDADLEYDPRDYTALLEPLLRNQADVVIGSRVLSGSMHLLGRNRAHWTSYIGCYVIAVAINLLYGRRGSDYYGCYKAFRREVLASVSVQADRFAYDSELLCKLFKRHVRVAEVPISYYPRSYREGKKLGYVRDGLAVLFSIVWWRFHD